MPECTPLMIKFVKKISPRKKSITSIDFQKAIIKSYECSLGIINRGNILKCQTKPMNFLIDFGSGMVSGMLACVSGHFLDTVKVRMQIDPKMTSTMYTIKHIVKH